MNGLIESVWGICITCAGCISEQTPRSTVSVLTRVNFSRVLLMEEPWTWFVVCPGSLQRPQRVWQAAGDNADPDTGQLHGGHQL